jgi:hypothetical protein
LNPSALPETDAADLKTTFRLGKNEDLHEAVAGEAELLLVVAAAASGTTEARPLTPAKTAVDAMT